MSHAPFVVLLQKIPVPYITHAICAALDNFVDSFSVHIKADQRITCVIFQNRLVAVVEVISGQCIVDRAFHTAAKRIVGKIVGKICGGDLLQLLVSHVVVSKSVIQLDLVLASVGYCATGYRGVLIDGVWGVARAVYSGAIACLIQSIREGAGQIRLHRPRRGNARIVQRITWPLAALAVEGIIGAVNSGVIHAGFVSVGL